MCLEGVEEGGFKKEVKGDAFFRWFGFREWVEGVIKEEGIGSGGKGGGSGEGEVEGEGVEG